MATDEVWKETVARLNRRENPKWESLSWVALRPLISSLNDQINRAAPELVDDLRRSWMQRVLARQELATIDEYQGIVDRAATESFLIMGDTGEQDASQYVLGPALRAAMDPAGSSAADFLLICSDVIYPSGDINDYPHGFYLPYEDLLHPPTGETAGEPAGQQRIYALPGNHDWYDGLTGFMHTFCGLDRLDPDSYVWSASWWHKLTRLEILGRMLWRRPSRPQPPIEALREERMGPFDPRTGQPGPYYAIQVKGLLLVCIDGGIGAHGDCEIDADQARWLLRISRSDQPKVLLTGYPLLVNGQWKACRIRWEAGTADDVHQSVNEIVADADHHYIASIGGDVHNFQYYDVEVGRPASRHRVRYLVSGGGGAYISATHPGPGATAKTVADLGALAPAVRAANAEIGGPAAAKDDHRRRLGPLPDVAAHPLIPAPARSLTRFTERVIPKTWRLIRSLIAFVAAAVFGTVLVRRLEPADPELVSSQLVSSQLVNTQLISSVLIAIALVLIVGALAYRIFVLGPPRVLELERDVEERIRRRRRYRRGITVFAAGCGFAVPLIAARIGPQSWFGYLAVWEVLTGLGILLAMLQRFSGWWREPAGDGVADHPVVSAVLTAAALVLVPAVLDLIGVLPFAGGRRWWIAVSAMGIVIPAVGGWPFRTRRSWRSRSRTIAPLAQLGAAAILVSTLPGAGSSVRPIAVLVALLLSLVLVLAAAVLTLLAIGVPVPSALLLWAGLMLWLVLASPAPRWPILLGASVVAALAVSALVTRRIVAPQRRLARYGGLAPTVMAVLVLAALVALTVTSNRIGAEPKAAAFLRVLIVVAWAATLTVLGVFGVDALRRTQPGRYRILATAIGALVIAVILLAPLENRWLAAGLVVTGLGLMLVTVTVALSYLAFLGGHSLLFDLEAHRDLDERPNYLIDESQAQQVIDWRQSQGRHQISNYRLERRAKFVTPSTDQPEGLIQQKISEFFSTDRPPFSQHFLELRVRASTLEITPRLVTGDATAGTEPGRTITIPL